MTPERWQQIQELLGKALERPAGERADYVAGVCLEDAELQREVESLLLHVSQGSGFLSPPALAVEGTTVTTIAAASTLVGKTISGRYRVKSRLGAGGMGDVYLADDAQLRCAVALKAVRESEPTAEGHARLLREARAAAALRDHANIAAIYDVLDADGSGTPPLIVMEYVEGDTLSDRLRRGPLPLADALRFARDTAGALAAAHGRGIMHRDLKPANLRVTRDGRIKVLDFGLARRIAAPVPTDTSTMSGEHAADSALPKIAGTPGYMSPEQLLGRPVGAPSDVFSLGVVLFEMIAGKRPISGDDFFSAATAMLARPIPRLAETVEGCPPEVDALVARMLNLDAGLRPAAAEVVTELDHVLRPQAAHTSAWRRAAIPAAALLVLAASAVVGREPLRRWFGIVPPGPPPRISLAILPVDPSGVDARPEYVAAGITSVIGANFGSIPRTVVYSRAATAAFQKDSDEFVGLQRALGATHVLKLSWTAVAPSLKLEVRLYRPGVPQPELDQTFEGDAPAIERKTLEAVALAVERNDPYRRFSSEEWRRVRRLPTSNAEALTAQAEARALLDRPTPDVDRAIALLQHATKLDPQFVLGWATLGDALWGKYNITKDRALVTGATDALRTALSLDPDNAAVYNSVGDMQYRTGDFGAAEASYRRALQQQPDLDAAQRGLAQVLSTSGRVDEAEAVMRAAIGFSRSWNNLFMLGTIEYRAGRYTAAADAFSAATQATPNNSASYTMLGTTQYVLGDLERAVGNFEHAVRLGPTRAAYANLALAYYDAGRYQDALHSYQEALERDPRSVDTHRNVADVDVRLGRRQDARAEYERAVALGNEMLSVNPRDVHTIALIALCEAKLGRRADAERHAAEAVAVDSSSREAWQRSAEVHAMLGQADAAFRDLEIAVARGFEPRMARRDDELASLAADPRFERILSVPPGKQHR